MARSDRGDGFIARFEGDSVFIRYDLNAAAAFEDETGYPIAEIFKQTATVGRSDAKNARAFIWAGMLFERPKITIREAGDLIGQYAEGETWKEKAAILFRRCTMEFTLSLAPEKKRAELRKEMERRLEAASQNVDGSGAAPFESPSDDLASAMPSSGDSRIESSSN